MVKGTMVAVVRHPRGAARILDESSLKPKQSGPPWSDQPP